MRHRDIAKIYYNASSAGDLAVLITCIVRVTGRPREIK